MTHRTKWKWAWAAFLLIPIICFAIMEGSALADPDGVTLSRFVYETNKAWPLLAVAYGILAGGLATHFFWHWHPEGDDAKIAARERAAARAARRKPKRRK